MSPPLPLLHQFSVRERRLIRRSLVLTALLPLTIVLGTKVGGLSGDFFLNAYGILVLGGTMVVFAVAFTRYDDPGRDRRVLSDAPRPLVTCMVAVHDDEAVIEACVRSLLESTYGPMEVIAVDDASTDRTLEHLRRLERDPLLAGRLEVLALSENVGKKRALVEAVRRARGTILVFTDSDCIVAPDAIEHIVAGFAADPAIGALSGHCRALNAERNALTRIQDVWYDGQFGVMKAAEASLGSVTCVSGPLAAFRREAVINFFPAWAADRFLGREFRFATDRQLTGYVLGSEWIGERLIAEHAEDPLVARERHPTRRWDVGYVRSARVWTNVPSTVRAVLRQQVRWKKSFIRNLFFTGRFYWRRGPLPALLFYGHVLWVVAAPFLAFRHLVWLPLQGAVLVTALYLCGVVVKGSMWGIAYRVQNRRDPRWVWRPLMSLISALFLAWLLPYSLLTLRRSVWSRQSEAAPERLPRVASSTVPLEGLA